MMPPRTFISYSHDSEQHNLKVLELANRLRQDGIDAFLDRYEEAPPQGWSNWSANQIAIADFVLSICTEKYRERFEEKTPSGWGVSFEGSLIKQAINAAAGSNRKFIPVVFDEPGTAIPSLLREYTYYKYPEGYDELYRRLSKQPAIEAPPLGVMRAEIPTAALPKTRVHSTGAVAPDFPLPVRPEGDHALNPQHLIEVQKVWLADRLSIVAGAGVSAEAKLPTWTALLRELLAAFVRKTYAVGDNVDPLLEELQQQLEEQSPLIYAQFVRAQFSDEEFTALVHKALYPTAARPLPGNLCRAIARLGIHLKSILTFNYDELLEDALSTEGHECTPIFDAEGWSSVSGMPVYHPHGYLPFERDSSVNYRVVLAEGDYHTQYHSPNSWSNIAISRVLLENVCLFVGISLTDPNLRRLLDAAHREQPKKTHYMLAKSPVPAGAQAGSIVTQAVPEVFAASYQQLGVTPIWFNDYGEIPGIIDSIRNLRPR